MFLQFIESKLVLSVRKFKHKGAQLYFLYRVKRVVNSLIREVRENGRI